MNRSDPMEPLSLKDAADALRVSAPELAEALGMSAITVRRMRLDPENPNHRRPPPHWERVMLDLARARLEEVAAVIQRLGAQAHCGSRS